MTQQWLTQSTCSNYHSSYCILHVPVVSLNYCTAKGKLTVSTQDSKLDSPVLKQEQLMFWDTRIKQSLNFSLSKKWDFPIFITTVYTGGHNLNTTTQIASARKIKNLWKIMFFFPLVWVSCLSSFFKLCHFIVLFLKTKTRWNDCNYTRRKVRNCVDVVKTNFINCNRYSTCISGLFVILLTWQNDVEKIGAHPEATVVSVFINQTLW